MADEAKKEKRNKKISHMSLAELDTKIADVRAKMGGDNSRHMLHLLKRKAALAAV